MYVVMIISVSAGLYGAILTQWLPDWGTDILRKKGGLFAHELNTMWRTKIPNQWEWFQSVATSGVRYTPIMSLENI